MSLPTLTKFFEEYYLPLCITGKNLDHKTLASYQETMRHWIRLTGDPAVDKITDHTVAQFVTGLCQSRGKQKGSTMKMSSVGKHCVSADSVLKTCGPRSRHNRRGQNLIPEPPFIEAPRADKDPPCANWTIAELQSMYRFADVAIRPTLPGVSPADWWRSLICTAFYTGLRITALTNVKYSLIHENYLTVEAKYSKGRKGIRKFLHPEALEHIKRIQTADRDVILLYPNWEKRRRICYDELRKIQRAAGMEKPRRFGFQSFRKTHASEILRLGKGKQQALTAAQKSCGHSSSAITTGHYAGIDVQDDLDVDIILRLPSPVWRDTEETEALAPQLPQVVEQPEWEFTLIGM